MSLAALKGANLATALDDPKLLKNLVSQAKSSHSNLGRSLDTSLSYRKMGGGQVEPSAMSVNRQEKQRQLDMQKKQQEAWQLASRMLFGDAAAAPLPSLTPGSMKDATHYAAGRAASPNATAAQATLAGSRMTQSAPSAAYGTAHTRSLVVPVLATMAPSFTKAADDGVDELGGTRLGGAGYTSRIAVIPTEQTVACIADQDELISSFRPYQHDALAAARQAAMREKSAPHPDLLRQLEPTLNAVAPNTLVDTGAIPEALLARQRGWLSEGEEANADAMNGDGVDAGQRTLNEEDAHMARGATTCREGTYPFLAVGRDRGGRRLPGNRQPSIGQYHVRYGEVQSRVTGGYIQPQRPAVAQRRGVGDDGAVPGSETLPSAHDSPAERPLSTTIGEGLSSFYGTMAGTHGLGGTAEEAETVFPPGYQRGDNIKGSSMFLSQTGRKAAQGTAAPDTTYWPYPDVRSTTKRVPAPVTMGVPSHHRRRELAASGVPTGMYDVAGDIASGLHNPVQMARAPGRDAHWYGKKDLRVQASTDFGDVDEALRATRPHERVVTLPERISEEEDRQRRAAAAVVDSSVSVERDLNYPRHPIGDPERLARTRAFDTAISREERDRVARGVNVFASIHTQDDGPVYEPETTLVEKRQQAAVIHPRAPGHGDAIGSREAGELGEVPNLKWTRPNNARGTQFGAGSKRPDHLLTMHDLSYNPEPGYRLIGPRAGGDPMIGSVVSRSKREKVFSSAGCGPQSGAVYKSDPLPAKVKSVPNFAHQITKETQFAGHRVPSERYERKNPKAPGPGFYDVVYAQVDKHESVANIQ